MSSEWTRTTLGAITTWLSGSTPKKSNPNFWNGTIPWISASSMHSTYLGESDLKITKLALESKSRLVPENTVLLLVRGSALHTRIPVGITRRRVSFNQDVKAIVPDGTKLIPKYLLYWLMGTRQHLRDSVVEYTGIGAGKLDTKRLQALPICLPTLEEQESIICIISAFDDRITLLRETNKTLESIAQAIFKSWFVNFDPVYAKMAGRQPEGMDEATAALFPDSFDESELGLIPKGWEALPFFDTVTVIGGGTPKTSIPAYWGGDIPWFSVVDAPETTDVWVLSTEKYITKQGLSESSAKLLPKGTTIISARGTVGRIALTGRSMSMNQSCYGLRGEMGDYYFTYFSTKRLVDTLKQHSHGSVFDTITRDTLKRVKVVWPPQKQYIEAFETTVSTIMDRILTNVETAALLGQLRDTLLPRLISGKLRLPEAQELVEANLQ